MASFTWPSTAGSGGVAAYTNFASFPATAADGTVVIALDTDILYAYNVGTASWVIIGGPGAALTVGTINSQTKSAKGAVIALDALIMQTADASFPGLMSTGTQTIAGAKTFSSAPTLSSLNTAGIVHTDSAGLLSTSLIVNADVNAAAAIAYSKLALSNSILNADINSAAAIAVSKLAALTVSRAVATDVSGFLTVATTTAAELDFVSGVTSAIQTQLNSKQATGNYITALTGDVTASGPGSVAATLAATSNATLVTLSGLTTASSLVSVGAITSGTWNATAVAITHGGTGQITKAAGFDALSPMTTIGDIIYGGTSGTGTRLAGNTASSTQLLSSVGSGGLATAPVWLTATNANTASTVVLRDGSGNFSAATISAALTGTASGNTTYTPNNHGVVLSGAANAMTVVAPNASTAFPLISGGSSADPTWAALTIAGGGTGQVTKAAAFDALSPMSASGDVIYGGASGTGTRLVKGSDGQVLTLASGLPSWAAATASNPNLVQNLLYNSAFDFWLRGTSLAIANGTTKYEADCWCVKNSLGTNGIITFSQVTGVTAGSVFGASVKITTAPTAAQTNGCELYQTLQNKDSAWTFSNSLSFAVQVKALTNVTQVGITLVYATTETLATTALAAETLFTVNSSTFTQCSIANVAVGTTPTATGVVGVKIRITAVSSGNTYDLNNGFVVEQANLIIGTTAPLTFARQGSTWTAEQLLCSWYAQFINFGGGGVIGAGLCTSTTAGSVYISLPAPFKASNTTTTISGTINVLKSNGSSQATTSSSVSDLESDHVTILFGVASGLTAGNATLFNGGVGASILMVAEII